MNEIKIFNNEEFGAVRTIKINEEPWFVAKDIADILEYSQAEAMTRRLDADEVRVLQNVGYGINAISVISESGLYTAVIGSKKPEAKKFRKWVTSEIIPSIRKHGAYMTAETIEKVLTDPDTIIQLATSLKEEQQKRRALEEKAATDAPKLIFAESVELTDDLITVAQLSNILKQNGIDIGEKRLYGWLRDNGYIYKDSRQPTQRALNLGLFRVVEYVYFNNSQEPKIAFTTKVTGRGQRYFVDKFLNKAA